MVQESRSAHETQSLVIRCNGIHHASSFEWQRWDRSYAEVNFWLYWNTLGRQGGSGTEQMLKHLHRQYMAYHLCRHGGTTESSRARESNSQRSAFQYCGAYSITRRISSR